MKITVLTENTALRPDLLAEHGLSLYIETQTHRILFDAGQTDAFSKNAEKLGVDLKAVDFCVLSHGHYDHGGGLKRFLEINDHAPVYLSRHAFGEYFSSGKYIGLDPKLENHPRLIPVGDVLEIVPGMTLISCNDLLRPFSFGVFGQSVRKNGIHQDDAYLHEQYLLVEENGQKFCFSGCSHKGVLNILHWFRPDVFFGGFHFIRMDPEGRELAEAARKLQAFPTRYFTGHCTGAEQYAALKETLDHRLEYLHTGTVIEL
ncbi:MAG: MBL fold metallo-hydrolase [Oscillospiraceae bacterium]|nr:MBL fold metallo-hydrolase [Oscillospiraceae bacterium]